MYYYILKIRYSDRNGMHIRVVTFFKLVAILMVFLGSIRNEEKLIVYAFFLAFIINQTKSDAKNHPYSPIRSHH